MKYKRLEDETTFRGKLHKFNIHSIRKKGDRFAGYLKILTGVEPQVQKNPNPEKYKMLFMLKVYIIYTYPEISGLKVHYNKHPLLCVQLFVISAVGLFSNR